MGALSCAGCERLHLSPAKEGEMFIRCRAGGTDPRFADRVMEKCREEYAEGHVERLTPPAWCPRRRSEGRP